MSTVVGFHGSPGFHEDFAMVESKLGFKFASAADSGDGFSDEIAVGYSWGCARLVEACVKKGMPKSVLFISPYFFPEKSAGFIKVKLLRIAFVRNFLLMKKGSEIVEKFLVKACLPDAVPERVREMTRRFSRPDILAQSVLEKEDLRIDEPFKRKFLAIAASRGTRIYVIAGSEDALAKPVQTEWLGVLSTYEQTVVPDAGHALIWTRSDIIAEKIKQLIRESG
ncbi:MAG: alpha/beta hydrolase [Cryobacterium sp.]|nr:alpha/beta hydrolase [Oligoflexia bacterium]